MLVTSAVLPTPSSTLQVVPTSSGVSGQSTKSSFRGLLRESLWYAVPSCLYMIDNNLLYYILAYIDAPTHILVRGLLRSRVVQH